MIVSKENNKKLSVVPYVTGQIISETAAFKKLASAKFVEAVQYDVASGNITTSADIDTGLTLPSGAIVTAVDVNVLTAVDSASDTATLTIKVADADVEDASGAIVTAATQASLGKGAATLTVTPVVTNKDTKLLLRAGTEAITAGKFIIFVSYILPII